MERLDVAVVGSGPAGLEAALNLRIRNKEFILFGHGNLSTKIEKAPRVDNYLGLPGVSGADLQRQFRQHLERAGIEIRTEQVSSIYPMGSYFALATNRDTYEARAVILAIGAANAKAYPGEERLLGKGVGYCATCDAPLYKGKTVAILGFGDEAVHEANFVSELAGKVYYLPVRKSAVPLASSVELLSGRVLSIDGEDRVSALTLDSGSLPVDGVFVLREAIAPAALLPGIELRDNYIRVDADMRTSIPGCFAAGDCTGKPHQYMRAAGQGQTAALNAVSYLDEAAL